MNLPAPLRETWLLLTGALAFASGIAQLATSGIWQFVLVGIFAASFLVLAVRLAILFVVQSNRRLRATLDAYREVLAYIAMRQPRNYRESISLTINIASGGGVDTIVERRTTSTTAPVLFRGIHLIRNFDLRSNFDSVVPSLRVEDATICNLAWLPLDDRGGWHGLITFHPEVSGTIRWAIEYDSPTLWDTLRRLGHDYLQYSLRDSQIDRLEVNFMFPAHARSRAIRERSGSGAITEMFDDVSNRHHLQWAIEPPLKNHMYIWDVTADWAART